MEPQNRDKVRAKSNIINDISVYWIYSVLQLKVQK